MRIIWVGFIILIWIVIIGLHILLMIVAVDFSDNPITKLGIIIGMSAKVGVYNIEEFILWSEPLAIKILLLIAGVGCYIAHAGYISIHIVFNLIEIEVDKKIIMTESMLFPSMIGRPGGQRFTISLIRNNKNLNDN